LLWFLFRFKKNQNIFCQILCFYWQSLCFLNHCRALWSSLHFVWCCCALHLRDTIKVPCLHQEHCDGPHRYTDTAIPSVGILLYSYNCVGNVQDLRDIITAICNHLSGACFILKTFDCSYVCGWPLPGFECLLNCIRLNHWIIKCGKDTEGNCSFIP